MAVGFAIDNSMTDHGGIIKATQMRASQMGNLFLVANDGHFCPKCKCWSKIIKSHDHVIFDGKSVAYVGDKLTCGAKILPKQTHVVGDSQASNYGNELVEDVLNIFDEQIQVVVDDRFKNVFKGLNYRLKVGNKIIEGVLDQDGKTPRFQTEVSEEISEFVLFFNSEIKKFSELESGE